MTRDINVALAGLFTDVYCTTYCNFGHDLRTGRPIDHECRIIPPAALQAERAGDFDRALQIMRTSPIFIVKGQSEQTRSRRRR